MKTLILFLSFIFCSTIIKSQGWQVEPGLKAGLNISNYHYSSPTNIYNYPVETKYTPRVSMNLGVLAHMHLKKHLALQPELIVFSGQGAKQSIRDTIYRTKFNYVNGVLLLQYMVGDGLRLETGPQLSYRLSAKKKSKYTSDDLKPAFKSYDLAWVFGAGYLFKSGFGVDTRFNLGLLNIFAGFPEIKYKNRVFQLGVFCQLENMKFMLGKKKEN